MSTATAAHSQIECTLPVARFTTIASVVVTIAVAAVGAAIRVIAVLATKLSHPKKKRTAMARRHQRKQVVGGVQGFGNTRSLAPSSSLVGWLPVRTHAFCGLRQRLFGFVNLTKLTSGSLPTPEWL
ncbi:hypothetical protein [Nocardia sp. XZ_19_369]|uniref:hypothetical protein n=1 Tax=Nocardia sp. XZ_19_369 TaxID=2769487 RepID=UPI00188F5124|nr:hypothetical protein [Nocardia sp. XZ_19_369]